MREAVGPRGADPGRRQRRLGRRDGEADARRARAARRRARRAARGDAGGGGARSRRSTSIPIAGDESIETAADAERAVALGACELTGIKLSKVGGPEAAIEIAEVLPSYLSSALDGPVGIAAAAQVAADAAMQAGGRRRRPRPRPRHPAPLRLDDRLGRVRAARRHAPPARRARPRRRDRRGGARRRTASSAGLATFASA